ncbi:hypothetical protein KW795_01520 [Candidatus Microgenomates bacterium]|nr:hypothetical protein [Candidatus Microgenomates bacterium]
MSDSSIIEIKEDRKISLEGKNADIFSITDRPTDVSSFLRDIVEAQGDFELREPQPQLKWIGIRNSESGVKKDQTLLFITGVKLAQSEWKKVLGYDLDSTTDLSHLEKVTANFCFANIDDLVKGYDLDDVYDSQVELYRILISNGLTNGYSLFRGLVGDGMFTAERTENEKQISLRDDFVDRLSDSGIKDILFLNGHGAGKGKERLYRDRIVGTHGTTVATVYEVLKAISETVNAPDGLGVINVSCVGEVEGDREWTPHLLIGALTKSEITVPVPLANNYENYIYCESDTNLKERLSAPASLVVGSREKGTFIQKYDKRKEIMVAGASLW